MTQCILSSSGSWLPCISERTPLTYHGLYSSDTSPKSRPLGQCHPFEGASDMDSQFEFDWDMLMSHSYV